MTRGSIAAAWAWLNLTRRRAAGEAVDEDDVRKHRNDVFRLVASLLGVERFPVPTVVQEHIREFVQALPPSSTEWDGIRSALKATLMGGTTPVQLLKALATAFDVQA